MSQRILFNKFEGRIEPIPIPADLRCSWCQGVVQAAVYVKDGKGGHCTTACKRCVREAFAMSGTTNNNRRDVNRASGLRQCHFCGHRHNYQCLWTKEVYESAPNIDHRVRNEVAALISCQLCEAMVDPVMMNHHQETSCEMRMVVCGVHERVVYTEEGYQTWERRTLRTKRSAEAMLQEQPRSTCPCCQAEIRTKNMPHHMATNHAAEYSKMLLEDAKNDDFA